MRNKLTQEEALQLADRYNARFQLQIDREMLAKLIKEVSHHSYLDGWDDARKEKP